MTALKDGSAQAAIVNNTQRRRAGSATSSSIFKEDLDNPQLAPYINAFVTRDDKKDDPRGPSSSRHTTRPRSRPRSPSSTRAKLQFKTEWTGAQLTEELTSLEDAVKAQNG